MSIPLGVELAGYAVLAWLAIATDLLTTQVIWYRITAALRLVRHGTVCRWRRDRMRFDPRARRMECQRCRWASPGWR